MRSLLFIALGLIAQVGQSQEMVPLRQTHEPIKLLPENQVDRPVSFKAVSLTASLEDIPEPVLKACYSVGKVVMDAGGSMSMGSSTYIGDGLWITNRHVVADGGRPSIHLKSGEVIPARVASVSRSSNADLAVLETVNVDNVVMPVAISDENPREGDIVFPSGFDRGNMSAVERGRVG
jgi:S1-C subfamily serine protease